MLCPLRRGPGANVVLDPLPGVEPHAEALEVRRQAIEKPGVEGAHPLGLRLRPRRELGDPRGRLLPHDHEGREAGDLEEHAPEIVLAQSPGLRRKPGRLFPAPPVVGLVDSLDQPTLEDGLDEEIGAGRRPRVQRGRVEVAGYQARRSAGRIGSLRIRLPVSAKTALATAGAIGGVPGSPTPPGGSALGMMWTSTTGISLMRSIG